LQRLVRQSATLPFLKSLCSKTRMKQNWKIEYSDEGCKHHYNCGCKMMIEGIGERNLGMKWEGTGGTFAQQYGEAVVFFEQSLSKMGDYPGRDEQMWFTAQIPNGGSIRLIRPPVNLPPTWPRSGELFEPAPEMMYIVKMADYRYIHSRLPHMRIPWMDFEKYVWAYTPTHDECVGPMYAIGDLPATVPPGPDLPRNEKGMIQCSDPEFYDFLANSRVPPLWALATRELSMWHWAFGRTNDRPHVVSAVSKLYEGKKLQSAILSMVQTDIGDRPRAPLKYLPQAFDHLYRMMGINLDQKIEFKLSFNFLKDIYLGASSGLNDVQGGEFTGAKFPVKFSKKGKKIEFFEQDLDALLEYLKTGREPAVYWSLPTKVENFFSWTKQLDDEEWDAFIRKVRVFNIPSSIFIYFERIVSFIRHMKERGKVIRIGHKWSRGGADSIAKCLGITKKNCRRPILVEGDIKNFDQRVRDFFVNLYFSTMGVHIDRGSVDFEAFCKINEYVLKNMVNRVTQLFGRVWGVVKGGVPSGAFNTSHMDSWIMALYFCLFVVYQLMMAPEEMQEELEEHALLYLFIVVYGDDHLYNKGEGKMADWFGGAIFAKFMKDHFDVVVRDLKDGIPFLSEVKNGWITLMGVTFLKHQFIENPCKQEGQCEYLPFRESREVIIRAIWSRETKLREPLDLLMSVVGQAYATYGANRDAYDRLMYLFIESISVLGDIPGLEQAMQDRMGHNDLKKMRQVGVTPEEIVSGFPTWQQVVNKNRYDESYQEISNLPLDFYDMDTDEYY